MLDILSQVAYGEVEVLRDLLRSSELVLDISRRVLRLVKTVKSAESRGFGPDGKNPLHLAARRGQVECIKLLAEEKADLQVSGFENEMPMVQARTGNKQQNMALHLAAMNKAEHTHSFETEDKDIHM